MSYHKDHNSDICTKAFVYNFLTWSFDLFLKLYLSDITREDPVAIAITDCSKNGGKGCLTRCVQVKSSDLLWQEYLKISICKKLNENEIRKQNFSSKIYCRMALLQLNVLT